MFRDPITKKTVCPLKLQYPNVASILVRAKEPLEVTIVEKTELPQKPDTSALYAILPLMSFWYCRWRKLRPTVHGNTRKDG